MPSNYGPCQVCGKDMIVASDSDEYPHTCHDDDCPVVDCWCQPAECHAECCVVCKEEP